MLKESLPGTITLLSAAFIIWVIRNAWLFLTSAPPRYVEPSKIIIPEALRKRSSTRWERMREAIPSLKQSARGLCGLIAWLMFIEMASHWFFTYNIFDHAVGWTTIFGSLFFIGWAFSDEPQPRPDPNLSKRGQAIAWRVGKFLSLLLFVAIIGGVIYLAYFDPESQAIRQKGARIHQKIVELQQQTTPRDGNLP